MIRNQIYLTEKENSALARLARTLGQGKSELIRQAIDEFIGRRDLGARLKNLRAARGMWSGKRADLDIRKIRSDFDRF
jgi:hypothetical protein